MSPTGPPDPDPPPPRRRMFGWIFWAALGFGLVCVASGALVGVWGPQLFPKPAAAASEPIVAAAASKPVQSPLPANFSAAAPSRTDIADRFAEAAAKALAASKGQARPADAPAATEPDAVLARARKAVAEGKLETAVCDIASLPPAGQKAMTAWREGVERRIAAEQHARGLGAAAAGS